MNLNELLNTRYSIRNYSDKDIPIETINEILEASILAPSGQNKQPWQFHIIRKEENISKLAQIIENKVNELKNYVKEEHKELFENYGKFFDFFRTANTLIFISSKPYSGGLKHIFTEEYLEKMKHEIDTTHTQSVSAAIMILLLKSTELGIGTCWNTNILVAKKEIEEFLKIRKSFNLECLISLGYPENGFNAENLNKKRLSLKKVSIFD